MARLGQLTIGLAVVAGSSLVKAQGPCDPTKGFCPPLPGFTQSLSNDFTAGTEIPADWIIADYADHLLSFGNHGLEFRLTAGTDAPYIWTKNYICTMIDWEWSGNDFASPDSTVQTNYFGKGITGDWDRGTQPKVARNMTKTFMTYTLDWKPDTLTWSIDGKVIRTLDSKDTDNGNHQYPQTPSRFHLGVWDAGNEGVAWYTVEWAGGYTDLMGFPYSMLVKSVTITPYRSCHQYNYTDTTGSSASVECLHNTSSSYPGGTRGTTGMVSDSVDPNASNPAVQTDQPDYIPDTAPIPPGNDSDTGDARNDITEIEEAGSFNDESSGINRDVDFAHASESDATSEASHSMSSSCTASTPENTQPGTAAGCLDYHDVQSGDTCETIAKSVGIGVDDLLKWNPQADDDCWNLWANYSICVSPPGECDDASVPTPTPAPAPTGDSDDSGDTDAAEASSLTTATIKLASTITVPRCDSTISNCPAADQTVAEVSTTVSELTTVCPMSEIDVISSSAADAGLSLVATPFSSGDVVPSNGSYELSAATSESPDIDSSEPTDSGDSSNGPDTDDQDGSNATSMIAPHEDTETASEDQEPVNPADVELPGDATPPDDVPLPSDMTRSESTTDYTTVCPAESTITTSGKTNNTITLTRQTTSTITSTMVTTVPIDSVDAIPADEAGDSPGSFTDSTTSTYPTTAPDTSTQLVASVAPSASSWILSISSVASSYSHPITSVVSPPSSNDISSNIAESSVPTSSPNMPTVSEIACPRSNGAAYTCGDGSKFEITCDSDFNGGDLRYCDKGADKNPKESCAKECAKTPGCKGFSVVGYHCYLKKTLGKPQHYAGCVRGRLVEDPPSSSSGIPIKKTEISTLAPSSSVLISSARLPSLRASEALSSSSTSSSSSSTSSSSSWSSSSGSLSISSSSSRSSSSSSSSRSTSTAPISAPHGSSFTPQSSTASTTSSAPSVVPSAEGYNSIGCYSYGGIRSGALGFGREHGKNILPFLHRINRMTVERCASRAKSGHFSFCGLKSGGECWMGNDLGAGAQKIDEKNCASSCAGNRRQCCGGEKAFMMYEIGGAGRAGGGTSQYAPRGNTGGMFNGWFA